mgnify:FL=1
MGVFRFFFVILWANNCFYDKKKMIMKRLYFLTASVAALVLTACNGNDLESSPVDMSDLASIYDDNLDADNFLELRGADEARMDTVYDVFPMMPTMDVVRQYEESDNKFLREAHDFFNTCAVAYDAWSWFEDYVRFSGDDYEEADDVTNPEYMTDSWLTDRVRNTDIGVISNSELRARAKNYIDSLVWAMSLDNEYEFEEGNSPEDILAQFVTAVNSTLHPFADKDVLAKTYEQEMIRLKGLASEPLRGFDYENGGFITQMLHLMSACKDFDTQCSLLLYWADHEDMMRAPEWFVAAGSRLLQSGHYSPLLYDVWVRWRALYQYCYHGSSTWSDIPNNFYNIVRLQCYESCLKHIASNHDDIMAMNCASLLAGRSNIQRFGWMFGNSTTVEINELMPNAFEE